jgi:hypothetical protein
MTSGLIRRSLPLAAVGAGLCLFSLAACAGSSSTSAAGNAGATGDTPAAAAAATAAAGGSSAPTVSSCAVVTAAQLSQAVGVEYKSITASGSLCDVSGPGAAGFDYTIEKESPVNTWSQQVAIIKGDDGQALSEPGIGDRAVWGGKEFAAEADGYIVGVIGADFPSTPQGSGFVRTGKIAKLLISKL